MVLLIQHPGDRFASAIARQLVLAGCNPVIVTVDEIMTCKGFSLRMEDGRYASRILLRRGTEIDSASVSIVINLVQRMPVHFIQVFKKTDADYVYQEWRAIFIAWIKSFGDKLLFNPATPTALSGIDYSRQEWMLMATTSGLPVAPGEWDTQNGMNTVFNRSSQNPVVAVSCFNGQAYSFPTRMQVPGSLRKSCLQLQALSGIPLLTVRLWYRDETWHFLDAGVDTPVVQGIENLVQDITGLVVQGVFASLNPQP
jgi:hypothetical protein